jgi:hypothetical protein
MRGTLTQSEELNHKGCVVLFGSAAGKVAVDIVAETIFKDAVEEALFFREIDELGFLYFEINR